MKINGISNTSSVGSDIDGDDVDADDFEASASNGFDDHKSSVSSTDADALRSNGARNVPSAPLYAIGVGGGRMACAGSAPHLGGRKDSSSGSHIGKGVRQGPTSWSARQPDARDRDMMPSESDVARRQEAEAGQNDDDDEDDELAKYGFSWRDTLSRFPSLLRLYPMATASDLNDESECLQPPGKQASDTQASAVSVSQGNGATITKEGATAVGATHERQGVTSHSSVASTGARRDPGDHGRQQPGAGSPLSSPPCTPGSAAAALSGAGYIRPGDRDVMRRPPSAGGSSSSVAHGFSSSGQGYRATHNLESAWGEVEAARHEVHHRQRQLDRREAAVERAADRNEAYARQLDELKLRLSEYGSELEENGKVLVAQQEALEEQRRQASEMRAHARRMCAAVVRDDVMSGSMRKKENPSSRSQ